jgi:hypothetical protein
VIGEALNRFAKTLYEAYRAAGLETGPGAQTSGGGGPVAFESLDPLEKQRWLRMGELLAERLPAPSMSAPPAQHGAANHAWEPGWSDGLGGLRARRPPEEVLRSFRQRQYLGGHEP